MCDEFAAREGRNRHSPFDGKGELLPVWSSDKADDVSQNIIVAEKYLIRDHADLTVDQKKRRRDDVC